MTYLIPMPKHAAAWLESPGANKILVQHADDGPEAQCEYYEVKTNLGTFGVIHAHDIMLCDLTGLGIRLQELYPPMPRRHER